MPLPYKKIWIFIFFMLIFSPSAHAACDSPTPDSSGNIDVIGTLNLCPQTFTYSGSFRLMGSSARIFCSTQTILRDTDPITAAVAVPGNSFLTDGRVQGCTIETAGTGIQAEKTTPFTFIIQSNAITATIGLVFLGTQTVTISENTLKTTYGTYSAEFQGKYPSFRLTKNIFSRKDPTTISEIGILAVGRNKIQIDQNTFDDGAYKEGIYHYNGANNDPQIAISLLGGNNIDANSVAVHSRNNKGLYITVFNGYTTAPNILKGDVGILSSQTDAIRFEDSSIIAGSYGLSLINGSYAGVKSNTITAGVTGLVATDQNFNISYSNITSRNGVYQYNTKLAMNSRSNTLLRNRFIGDGGGIGVDAYQLVGSNWKDNFFSNYATGMKITNTGIDNCCENSQNDCDASYGKCGNTCFKDDGTVDISGTGLAVDRNTIISNEPHSVGIEVIDSRYLGIGDPYGPIDSNTISVEGPCIKISNNQTKLFNRIGVYYNRLTCNTNHPVEVFVASNTNKQQDNEFFKNIVNYVKTQDPSIDPPVFITKRTYSCHGDYSLFPWFFDDQGFVAQGNCYDDISGDGETQLCWGSDSSKPNDNDLCDQGTNTQETYFDFPSPTGSCF